MIGVYDYCGHYEWTFEWLRKRGGEELVRRYWEDGIYRDSQSHATELIHSLGFEGMARYWDHTLVEEGALFTVARDEGVFRIDMHACPSKGFLLDNGLEQYHDYCDHCMGWIGPLMKDGGFGIDHEHNHRGQCWWEMREEASSQLPSEPGTLAGENDVRLKANWPGDVQNFARVRPAEKRDD